MDCNDERKVVMSTKINETYETNVKKEKRKKILSKIEKANDWFLRNIWFIFNGMLFIMNYCAWIRTENDHYFHLSVINLLVIVIMICMRIYFTLKVFIKYVKGEE